MRYFDKITRMQTLTSNHLNDYLIFKSTIDTFKKLLRVYTLECGFARVLNNLYDYVGQDSVSVNGLAPRDDYGTIDLAGANAIKDINFGNSEGVWISWSSKSSY